MSEAVRDSGNDDRPETKSSPRKPEQCPGGEQAQYHRPVLDRQQPEVASRQSIPTKHHEGPQRSLDEEPQRGRNGKSNQMHPVAIAGGHAEGVCHGNDSRKDDQIRSDPEPVAENGRHDLFGRIATQRAKHPGAEQTHGRRRPGRREIDGVPGDEHKGKGRRNGKGKRQPIATTGRQRNQRRLGQQDRPDTHLEHRHLGFPHEEVGKGGRAEGPHDRKQRGFEGNAGITHGWSPGCLLPTGGPLPRWPGAVIRTFPRSGKGL